MPRIELLKDSTVRKIAAGEVIVRPSSVVKELLENSLDAGAKRITIEVRRGGKDLIRVIDNGCGMEREDVPLSIHRYATSKLKDIEDLNSLSYLGFRGEALASIASVSKLKIITNTDDSKSATLLEAEEGKIKEIRECARPRGTTVEVNALFYNLPVRRGFLKSPNYELRLIIETIKSYGIAYPEVSFTLISEGEEILLLPEAGSIKERLQVFYSKEEVESLKECRIDNPTISIYGYISDPLRPLDYPLQLTYFNKRPARNRVVGKVMNEVYGSKQNPPGYLLFFKIPPELLDVNIHPTKSEVRFKDERFLYDFLTQTVKKTLDIKEQERIGERLSQQDFLTEERERKFWQLHNSYIFAQVKTGYVIIDQHVAHERIIYEEILEKRGQLSQKLLFPITIELPWELYSIFEEVKDTLASLGIEAKGFGERTIVIEAVPAETKIGRQEILELLMELKDMDKAKLHYEEEVAKVIACKAAIKAGKRLSQEEMESLINRLFACQNPYFCPHGRPIIIRVSLEDLNRKFGRE